MKLLYIALLLLFSTGFASAIDQEWKSFLQSKNYRSSKKSSHEHQFRLLSEFSQQQLARCRPYIPTIDRAKNCRPYLHNRITLADGREMSASPIVFPDPNYQTFIATQAPYEQNVPQFWQMVVEKQILQIVMLTELSEARNPSLELASPYWPESGTLILENGIEVTLVEQKELPSKFPERIQIRKLRLRHAEIDRLITHYWYRNWMDNTVPESQTILNLIQNVKEDRSPVLVHCAAGVGRTGVFIVLYHLAQRAKRKDKSVRLFDLVAFLRQQRPHMVATLSQYQFCYRMTR